MLNSVKQKTRGNDHFLREILSIWLPGFLRSLGQLLQTNMQRSMRSKQNINEVAYDEKSIKYLKATPGSITFDRSSANSI